MEFNMETIIQIINGVGFPIFVAIWLLVKDAKEKEQTRQVISELKDAVNDLKEIVKLTFGGNTK